MFTGIVRELGTVASITRRNGLVQLAIDAPKTAPKVEPLESVAINGVCLSVVERRGTRLCFDAIPETLRLTSLGALRGGDRVNLEPSLSLTDRIGGQLVFGHVDGMGRIAARRVRGGETILEIAAPSAVARWLVPKGPITVDGVSLTIGERVRGARFTVHLIPETLRQTTLAQRAAGDRVNLELDYFAKLVDQLLRRRR